MGLSSRLEARSSKPEVRCIRLFHIFDFQTNHNHYDVPGHFFLVAGYDRI
jgi:hypothetical protein